MYIFIFSYGSKYNVHFNDTDSAAAVLEDVKFYKKSGGGTIVENTSHGIKRDIPLMQKASKESGVHVIAGTGTWRFIIYFRLYTVYTAIMVY